MAPQDLCVTKKSAMKNSQMNGPIPRRGTWLLCMMFWPPMALMGCTTVADSTQQGPATEQSQRCVPSSAKRARAFSSTFSVPSAPPTAAAAARFSPEALRIAEVVGVLPLLNEISELSASSRQEPLELLIRRQRFTDRILLTFFEVASATAEIVCERDRADQVADRIDEVDSTRVKSLTIASIVIGSIAGIVSGGVGLAAGASVAGDSADVGGGLLASWFGVSALFTHSEVEFHHDRNLLEEIWNDPQEPQMFSPALWRFLHRPQAAGRDTPREQVLNAWRQPGRLGEQGSGDEQQRRALLFGHGGRYTASDLRARASMLETLESSIRLLHEELEVLVQEMAGDDARVSRGDS